MIMLNDTSLIGLTIKALSAIGHWREGIATRAELTKMSDLELKDIGISRNDIDAVADGNYVDTRGGFRHVSLSFARPGWKCGAHGMAR
jgi:uncharacterized protein YjiS (DUF1127 family)